MNKPTGGPAFPSIESLVLVDPESGEQTALKVVGAGGMSLRDYFAAHANIEWAHARAVAKGQFGENFSIEQVFQTRVAMSLKYADVMIAEGANTDE